MQLGEALGGHRVLGLAEADAAVQRPLHAVGQLHPPILKLGQDISKSIAGVLGSRTFLVRVERWRRDRHRKPFQDNGNTW
ncbi:hypothetical protein Aglo03_19490 [Actinokineospora globicatena]|uniref:Uncharacterized protein n=1 Tax=Actinokineospora globicatena TaxID=103729 RepID=A0A9W6QIM0_9PSEU|nr:hypothetical protein Aglo03_19490 [Actinokineospora globicatena]